LQGAATWWIHCHDFRATCHIAGCSGVTCHWIRPVEAPWMCHAIAVESWHWIRQVAAPCSVAGGFGMTCHWIHPNVRFLKFYIWFRFRPHYCSRHVILHQCLKFYPNRTTLGRKKWRHVDF